MKTTKAVLFLLVLTAFIAFPSTVSADWTVLTYGDLEYGIERGNTTDCAIIGCNTDATEIVIPASINGRPVTSIQGWAFRYCDKLKKISIPDSVTLIGHEAFEGCSSLESIIIPESVTQIDYEAFTGCSSLAYVRISNTTTTFDSRPFDGCSSLTSAGPLDGGYSIEYGWNEKIPDGVFSNCANLRSIIIPDGIDCIGERAFWRCNSLSDVSIPSSVATIGASVMTY